MFESKKSYRDTRADFERHLNLLMESIITRKRIIPKGYFRPNEGIFRLKHTPNKRINLNTIDEKSSYGYGINNWRFFEIQKLN